MKRFNLKIYFPFDDFDFFWERIETVTYSRHFRKRSKEKDIPRPTKEILMGGIVIECETDDSQNFVTKIVVRVPCTRFTKEYLTRHKDYIYVVKYDGKVISSWVNKHKDKHRSLQRDNYVRS